MAKRLVSSSLNSSQSNRSTANKSRNSFSFEISTNFRVKLDLPIPPKPHIKITMGRVSLLGVFRNSVKNRRNVSISCSRPIKILSSSVTDILTLYRFQSQ